MAPLENSKSEFAVLPDGWSNDEQDLVNSFFYDKLPRARTREGSPYGHCSASNCDEWAQNLLGGPVVRSLNQGCSSYTLICPKRNKIIQFRLEELDTPLIDKAHQIWGDMVPRVLCHGHVPLPVYTSNIVPGRLHFSLDIDRSNLPLEREKLTVIGIAILMIKATQFPDTIATSELLFAEDILNRLEQNTSLKQIDPEVHA